jgi:hypothetical protein
VERDEWSASRSVSSAPGENAGAYWTRGGVVLRASLNVLEEHKILLPLPRVDPLNVLPKAWSLHWTIPASTFIVRYTQLYISNTDESTKLAGFVCRELGYIY